jgi:hypothetical protein
MKISYVYGKVNEAYNLLSSIDFNTQDKARKTINQSNINKSYEILDKLRKELIVEHKRQLKQKGE